MNGLIRPMAREEGAVLVDLEAAFLAQDDLSQLFSDNVHPNDRGYAVMAEAFFEAISAAQGASGLAAAPRRRGNW